MLKRVSYDDVFTESLGEVLGQRVKWKKMCKCETYRTKGWCMPCLKQNDLECYSLAGKLLRAYFWKLEEDPSVNCVYTPHSINSTQRDDGSWYAKTSSAIDVYFNLRVDKPVVVRVAPKPYDEPCDEPQETFQLHDGPNFTMDMFSTLPLPFDHLEFISDEEFTVECEAGILDNMTRRTYAKGNFTFTVGTNPPVKYIQANAKVKLHPDEVLQKVIEETPIIPDVVKYVLGQYL